MLYPRDLKNCKWPRHKTYMDDRHLRENVFNVFSFCRPSLPVLTGRVWTNQVVYKFNLFPLTILAKLVSNTVQSFNVQQILTFDFIEHSRLSVFCPETKNLDSSRSQKRKRLVQPNFVQPKCLACVCMYTL